jgi:hypothetical protein
MMSKSRGIVIIVLILAVAVLSAPQSAQAGSVTGSFNFLTFPGADSNNCGEMRAVGSVTVTANGVGFAVSATDGNGVNVYSRLVNPGDPGSLNAGTYSAYRAPFQVQPTRNPIRMIIVIDGDLVGDVSGNDPCLGGQGVEWFNPGDSRIDGRPGDRIAVYCDVLDTVVVWGIDDKSNGVPLATFDLNDLVAAGRKGLTERLGNYGSVFAVSDSQGNLWIAWSGGPFNATGRGDFAKSLNCNGHIPGVAPAGRGTLGDGRADGRPGDRIAIYCDAPDSLVVWGIDNESRGFPLTTFSAQQLKRAGPRGITRKLGSLGSISASVDAKNNFWVAWNGGVFSANGLPNRGFAKGFQCKFSS